MAGDAVIFSHFIAINVVVGAANKQRAGFELPSRPCLGHGGRGERRLHFDQGPRARGRRRRDQRAARPVSARWGAQFLIGYTGHWLGRSWRHVPADSRWPGDAWPWPQSRPFGLLALVSGSPNMSPQRADETIRPLQETIFRRSRRNPETVRAYHPLQRHHGFEERTSCVRSSSSSPSCLRSVVQSVVDSDRQPAERRAVCVQRRAGRCTDRRRQPLIHQHKCARAARFTRGQTNKCRIPWPPRPSSPEFLPEARKRHRRRRP